MVRVRPLLSLFTVTCLVAPLAADAGLAAAFDTETGPTTTPDDQDAEQAGELVDDLAAVGIAVHADPTVDAPLVEVAAPASPLVLLRDQLVPLAGEVRTGGGLSGASLDALAPLPEGAPPLSYLVASWLTTHESPSTTWARDLMGGVDAHEWTRPDQVLFPRLVLLLFVSDLARTAAAESAAGAPAPSTSDTAQGLRRADRAPTVATVCGLAGWINSTINSIFEALSGDGTLPPIVQFVVDGAVALAQGVVEAVVSAISLPLDIIVGAITIVGVVGTISTAIWPWYAELTPVEAADHFQHPGEAEQHGRMLLTFSGTPDLWSNVATCVQAAGIDLPSGSPAGAPITWTPAMTPLLSVLDGDPVVGPDETAELRYVTAWEPAPPTPDSILRTAQLSVTARVEMLSTDDIAAIVDVLVGGLPFGSLLVDLFAPTVASIGHHLADKTYASGGTASVLITYHETPAPTTSSTAATTTTIPPSCPVGSWVSTGYQGPDSINWSGGDGIVLNVAPDLSGEIDFAGSVIVATSPPDSVVSVVAVLLQLGGFSFRLAGAGPTWQTVDVVPQGYDAEAEATIDGAPVDANLIVDELLSSGSLTQASATLTCQPGGTLVWSAPGPPSSYTFVRTG